MGPADPCRTVQSRLRKCRDGCPENGVHSLVEEEFELVLQHLVNHLGCYTYLISVTGFKWPCGAAGEIIAAASERMR